MMLKISIHHCIKEWNVAQHTSSIASTLVNLLRSSRASVSLFAVLSSQPCMPSMSSLTIGDDQSESNNDPYCTLTSLFVAEELFFHIRDLSLLYCVNAIIV